MQKRRQRLATIGKVLVWAVALLLVLSACDIINPPPLEQIIDLAAKQIHELAEIASNPLYWLVIDTGTVTRKVAVSDLFDNIDLDLGTGVFDAANFQDDPTTNNTLHVGTDAGGSGVRNVAVGEHAGENTTGNNSVWMGYQAGQNATNHNMTYVGYQAGRNQTGSNSTIIGYGAGINQSAANAVIIGYGAGYSQTGYASTLIGTNAGYGSTADRFVAIGMEAGQGYSGTDNVAIGFQAAKGVESDLSVYIGTRAGAEKVAGSFDRYRTAVGYQALWGTNITEVQPIPLLETCDVAVGTEAGLQSTGVGGTYIGFRAGYTNTGRLQTVVGNEAGQGNTGHQQTGIGLHAGWMNTGDNQSVVGYHAGQQNTADNQTAMGYEAGKENIGISQTVMGVQAGYLNEGDDQVGIGYLAGKGNTGNNVTGIGYQATVSNTADNVMALGYQAGKQNTVANQFIVKQANVSATPVLTANFSTLDVTLPGGDLGIGISDPKADLHVRQGAGSAPSIGASTVAVFQRSASTNLTADISVISGNAGISRVNFGDTDAEGPGKIEYNHTNNYLRSMANNTWVITTTSTGMGIKVPSTADAPLHVEQPSNTGAKPVLKLRQLDVSEEFIRVVGYASAGNLNNNIITATDVTTATLMGYLEIYVQDDGNQVPDGSYAVPFYSLQ